MNVFLFILTNNVLPIFMLVILGFILSKKFELDIFTLTKLNFYVFVPAFTFVNLYTSNISLDMIKILIGSILMIVLNFIGAFVVSKLSSYDSGMKYAFANSIMFYNSGNIGIPLITLIFSSPPFIVNGEMPYLNMALTAQVMVLVIQNITTNSIGFINAGRANAESKEALMKVLKMPAIYAVPLAMIFKSIPYDITSVPIWPALNYAKDALVPMALITLGVQLSRTTLKLRDKDVYLSVLIRLVGGPIFALGLIYLLDMQGIVAQVLMISASVPTAVNSALIAVEYDNYPDFSSQVVVTSTLLSAVSLVAVIYLAGILFPVI